MLSATFLT